jgi:hypothetical protein
MKASFHLYIPERQIAKLFKEEVFSLNGQEAGSKTQEMTIKLQH